MLKALVIGVVLLCSSALGMYAYEVADTQSASQTVHLGWMLVPGTSLLPETQAIDVRFILPPGCGSQGKLSTRVDHRATEVAIGLELAYQPNCLMSGGPADVHIELLQPLGDRTVVPMDEPNLTPADFIVPPPPTVDPAFLNDPKL